MVPTNIGVEVFVLVLTGTIKLMVNVPLFSQLMYVLLILNPMELTVCASQDISQLHLDHVINVLLVLFGMVKHVATEVMELINVKQVGSGIQLKLAAIILEVAEEMRNLMEQTADASKVSI